MTDDERQAVLKIIAAAKINAERLTEVEERLHRTVILTFVLSVATFLIATRLLFG